MKECGQAEVHGIDVGIAQNGRNVAVLLDRREIEALARAAQVALCGREVAGELSLIVGKNRRQGCARHLAQSTQVNAAHKTQSKHRDAHRFTILPRGRGEMLAKKAQSASKSNSAISRA
jgi:hypothetical protein